MNELSKNVENFVGYEYREIAVKSDLEGIYADSYPHFGWQLDSRSTPALGVSTVNLKFKRDRMIRNKAELSRLQRQFEVGVEEIQNLERSKTTTAQVVALSVGLLGTAFIAGSTFSFIYANLIVLMIVLAVPGFLGWLLSYPLYKRVRSKRCTTVAPLIDNQYDALYETCAKAHTLLAE